MRYTDYQAAVFVAAFGSAYGAATVRGTYGDPRLIEMALSAARCAIRALDATAASGAAPTEIAVAYGMTLPLPPLRVPS